MVFNKYKLSDIADKIGDGLHGTPKYSEQGNYYFINGNNLKDGSIIFKDDTKRVDEEQFLKNRRELNDRTIMFSINGTLGNIAKYNGEKIILGKSVCYVNIKDDYNLDYIYYVFESSKFKRFLQYSATGTTIKNVPLGAIRDYEISIPDISNQNKIARVLKTIDNKIKLNQQMNNNLYQMGECLYKNLFEKENGRNGCTNKTLGEVTINNRTKIDNTKNYTVLSAINSGDLVPSDEYFSKQVYSKDISKYLNVGENDFAYNPARINIGSIGLNNYTFPCCVSPVYVTFSVDNEYVDYFDFYFKSKYFKSQVALRALGSVRQTLNYDDFSLINISYPSKDLINDFNTHYSIIKKRIKKNNEKIEQLEQLKWYLLPKLLSGEIE